MQTRPRRLKHWPLFIDLGAEIVCGKHDEAAFDLAVEHSFILRDETRSVTLDGAIACSFRVDVGVSVFLIR